MDGLFCNIMCTRSELLCSLPAVTVSTQHLTIICRCVAALAPRCYMVSVHLAYFEMFATIWANTLLSLICFYSVGLVEIADIEMSFVTREDICIHTFFIRDISVY